MLGNPDSVSMRLCAFATILGVFAMGLRPDCSGPHGCHSRYLTDLLGAISKIASDLGTALRGFGAHTQSMSRYWMPLRYWSVPIMRVPYSQGLRWICQGVLISRLLDIRSFVEKPPGTPQAIVRVSRNLTEALTGSTEDALARCTKPKILCSVKPTYNYKTQFMS